jgi:hypothetical protein
MPRLTDARFDFRGGVNSTFSPDTLDATELVNAKNARLTTYGAVGKRSGTQRLHATGLGGASAFSSGFSSGFGSSATNVTGLVQWDNPSQASEVVAICNGSLYHKALADADFTTVASTLSTTALVSFAPYRVGGVNRLYFADGTLRKWTATTLTTAPGDASVPSPLFLAVYKERMFAIDGTHTIYWSKIADPEVWAAPNGGQANVDTYDIEPIKALATVGSSLLIFKEDSIARFTGTEATTIKIDKETEGVSPDVGCIAPGTVVRVDDFVFFLSDRGPYIANESGVQPIGQKIEAELDNWSHADWTSSWAVHNKDRREILLFVPTETGITGNNIAWCWNMRTQSWTGPWAFNFNVCVAATQEKSDSTEGVIFGGEDGFVRDGDIAINGRACDDVLSDNTGGVNVEMEVEFPPFVLGDPGRVKLLQATQYVQANLGADGVLVASGTGEERGTSASTFTINPLGTDLVASYKFHLAWRGRRPILKFTDSTVQQSIITGLQITAELGRRVA